LSRQSPSRDRSRRAPSLTTGREGGQGLVEFGLVLTPLLLILLGVIQFGFIFNTHITASNAAREGGREGATYVYDRQQTKASNDFARNEAIKGSVLRSLDLARKASPQFSTGSWTQAGSTFTSGDLQVTYTIPAGIADSDTRRGQHVSVRVTYHQDLMIPLIATLLPRDAGGRLVLASEVTMVIR
jgi:Flp pilus assembly protein TadG